MQARLNANSDKEARWSDVPAKLVDRRGEDRLVSVSKTQWAWLRLIAEVSAARPVAESG